MDNYENPAPGKTYISPALTAFNNPARRVRIISKVLDPDEAMAFGTVKGEVVLRRTDGAQVHIRATFYEDDRSIETLTIQGYTAATDKPRNASFSLRPKEVDDFLEFIETIRSVEFKDRSPINISDEELRRIALSNKQAEALFKDNEEIFAEIVRLSITKHDIVAVGYRKRQLAVFEKLLNDDSYFESLKGVKECSDEGLWQKFFEKNPWIFGYGLSFVYLSSLDDKKLEQIVAGSHVGEHGKRVDALLKSRGLISNLCFVEIKTHKTKLLASKPYRGGCWPPSSDLAGAVSQIQGTVALATETLKSKLNITDDSGYPTGELAFNYQPKSFLVVGSLKELVGSHGINEEQFRSIELYRRQTLSPEIITFDEIYERAKYIVSASDNSQNTDGSDM